MASKSWFRLNRSARKACPRPHVEFLEDRCMPAGLFPLPPGQNIFQFTNAYLQNVEATRAQVNASINALETQQITQLQTNLNALDLISQALIAKITQDRQQFNTDIINGAPLETQIMDLQKIQQDGAAAGAGIAQVSQLKQAAIQQTIRQLQLDEQLRFSFTQMINQQESSFVNAVLPAILAAEQAINAAGPQVGLPLTAGQNAKFAGNFKSTMSISGFSSTASTDVVVTVFVGTDGLTLTGPASASVTTSNVFTNIPVTTNTTAGSIGGSLFTPNGTAASGAFSFTFGSGSQAGTEIAPWAGFLGTNLFVGQIKDPATGVLTPFVFARVQ